MTATKTITAADNRHTIEQIFARNGGMNPYENDMRQNYAVYRHAFQAAYAARHDIVLPMPLSQLRQYREIRDRNLAEMEVAMRQGLADKGLRIACAKGCHFCCFQHVMMSTAEFAWILDHLVQQPAEAPRILERARRAAPDVIRLGRSGRYNAAVACPALGPGGLCTIYEARPEACQTYFSMRRMPCEIGWRKRHRPEAKIPGIPAPALSQAFGHVIQIGFAAACAESGLEIERVELTVALAFAAEQPGGLAGVLERWLAGERQFGSIAETLPASELQMIALEKEHWL